MYLSIPITPQSLSSAKTLSLESQSVSLASKLSNLSLASPSSARFRTMQIRMGGGPRTYPGGVTKWQWKRMQAKKAKQLLKARLARERQIYEMRKRAELKAAVSELERPWETVEKPPNLFSVGADEQLKVLADRFQRPGGFDMWSERDGPELFRPDDGSPSTRFFPKGVVHSVKPYRKSGTTSEELERLVPEEDLGPGPISGSDAEMNLPRKIGKKSSLRISDEEGNARAAKEDERGNHNRKLRKKGNRKTYLSDSERMNSRDRGYYNKNNGTKHRRRGANGELRMSKNNHEKGENVNAEAFDMSLQNDGTYGFELES